MALVAVPDGPGLYYSPFKASLLLLTKHRTPDGIRRALLPERASSLTEFSAACFRSPQRLFPVGRGVSRMRDARDLLILQPGYAYGHEYDFGLKVILDSKTRMSRLSFSAVDCTGARGIPGGRCCRWGAVEDPFDAVSQWESSRRSVSVQSCFCHPASFPGWLGLSRLVSLTV